MVSLADILSELDFLQTEASEELALSMVLQIVFAVQSLSTTLDISIATSDLMVGPGSIYIDNRGIVSLDTSSYIRDWQSKQSHQLSSQTDLFHSHNDPNSWIRANLQGVIAYAKKLHVSGCSSLISALTSLIQQRYIEPSDILACQEVFALFTLLFNKLGIITGTLQTPLMILIKFHSQMVEGSESLDAYQAQLGFQDVCGRTALMYAVHYDWKLCSRLVQQEARTTDKDGCTALMHAAVHGNRNALLVLIPYEAACTTPQGYTALMYAASNHRFQCVLDLIPHEAGMASNCEDFRHGEGFTALMAAADAGATDIVSALLPHEAWMRQKPSEEFPLGKRAYDYAIMRNRTLCAQVLQQYTIESYT
ncbi:Hypothetical protein GLP15_4704 [Giardia lamblia P15]|uniref:Uncharacterized protein n=1 Tax=Giardia intestinalis (strain P15) TaxID=658858 RepID=E1F1Q4_GIAIA|nr:Hypothetical protein GLP15_4704 [Giardia lamblia P15]